MVLAGGCASATGAEWTFAPASPGPASPTPDAPAPGSPAPGSPAPGSPAPGSPAPTATADVPGDVRVIEIEATGALQFTQGGEQVRDIPVTPGETVLFRVDNTAGFDHNLYIGRDDELSVPNATTDVGIPTWQSGVQELEWTVPEDITGLKFGCTVPGHYAIMQGTFSVQG
jgi:hypothetical protein